jgi:hypothetical protein
VVARAVAARARRAARSSSAAAPSAGAMRASAPSAGAHGASAGLVVGPLYSSAPTWIGTVKC